MRRLVPHVQVAAVSFPQVLQKRLQVAAAARDIEDKESRDILDAGHAGACRALHQLDADAQAFDKARALARGREVLLVDCEAHGAVPRQAALDVEDAQGGVVETDTFSGGSRADGRFKDHVATRLLCSLVHESCALSLEAEDGEKTQLVHTDESRNHISASSH